MDEDQGFRKIGSLPTSYGRLPSNADSTPTTHSPSSATTGEGLPARRASSSIGKQLPATTADISAIDNLVRDPRTAAMAFLPSSLASETRLSFRDFIDPVYGFDTEFSGYRLPESISGDEHAGAVRSIQSALAGADAQLVSQEIARLWLATKHREQDGGDLKMMGAVYAEEMKRYPSDVVVAVCRGWIRKPNGKFWPSLSEMVEEADRLTEPRELLLSTLLEYRT